MHASGLSTSEGDGSVEKVVVGLKPGVDNTALLDLACSVLDPRGELLLVSLVQVGKDENQLRRLEQVKGELQKLTARLRAEGYRVETEVQLGMVGIGTDLARLAERAEADLLVIGLTKRSRVGKALLGSDAQSTLLHATCPVLSLRFG
jgi:nucleotide-binding universal stress UspA family protein